MYKRSIFNVLETHLTDHAVTVITGMRRTGKTTALQYLLDKIPHNNKLYLDMERPEDRSMFTRQTFNETQGDLEFKGIDFTKAAVIALDEIQLIPDIASFIKYYHDHFPVKFILTGSSSYYLKNRITESLSGRKQIFEMYPLDFPEFLLFKNVDAAPLITQRMQPFRRVVFAQYKSLYEEYLQFGGFPQVVLADSTDRKQAILRDILTSYLELDVKILSDYSVIDDLFKLVGLLAARIGSKLDYQKIGVLLGISRHKIKDYIQLFEMTYFLHLLKPYVHNADRAIAVQPKIFLADTGLVNQFAQVDTGALFENALALQLLSAGKLQYYQRKSGQEIDFILNEQTAIEVKETPTPSDLKTLQSRAADIGLSYTMLVGRYPPGNGFADFTWGGTVFGTQPLER
ncbi:MAG: ATP-binding protein [Saprospiraceae bacterium]